MKGLQAPKHRCPRVPKAEKVFPVPRVEKVSQVSEGISYGACRASLGSEALCQVGDGQSQSNTLPGPASPQSSWPVIAQVSSDRAETHQLQKKQEAQKDPSTCVAGEDRDQCPAGLGQGSQIRHCLEAESLSWAKDTPEPTSGLSQKSWKGIKHGLLDEGLQQQLKSSSSCQLGFTWLSN